MATIQLFSTDFITVEYNEWDKMICHTVHRPLGDEQVQMFKDAVNAGTEALKQYGATKWLSDDRKNGPLPDEIVEWAATDWNQRTINAGWKYWANVVPEGIHAAGTLAPVIEHLHTLGLRMEVFVNIEEARQWLNSK